MIAVLKSDSEGSQISPTDEQFVAMLPSIRRQAAIAFRNQAMEEREDSIQEVIASAFCSYVQLARRGKTALAYATPLAIFAIRQVRAGRRVGCSQNANDVMSPVAQHIHGLRIKRLDHRDDQTGDWNELLIEDRKAGPADTAAARLDLSAWYALLPRRHRRIARALAAGGKTSAVARQFGLTAGRISQLRAWFQSHWAHFQGYDLSVNNAH